MIDKERVLARASQIMFENHGSVIRSRQVKSAIEAIVDAINKELAESLTSMLDGLEQEDDNYHD